MRRLRILGVTNLYPPAAGGGYGEICADTMRTLAESGHAVEMLVARGESGAPVTSAEDVVNLPVEVRRELTQVLAAWRRPRRALRAVRHDEEVVRAALARRPDVAIVWHLRGLTKPPVRLLHEAGIPVLYMLHDRWPLYERPGSLYVPWARLDRLGAGAPREAIGRLLAARVELRSPPIVREGTVCFVSEWLREAHRRAGWVPRCSEIVRCGVQVEAIRALRSHPPADPPRRLLFAGRVDRDKGLHVVVEALARLPELELTIAGPAGDEGYVRRVRARADELGVAARMTWLGALPRAEALRQLAAHDVLVFPSIGVEAYALGLLEALAAGTLVVTSARGGPREYLRHEDNALFFEACDAEGLGHALRRLAGEPGLAARLLDGARATAEEISLHAMIDQLEELLAHEVGREPMWAIR